MGELSDEEFGRAWAKQENITLAVDGKWHEWRAGELPRVLLCFLPAFGYRSARGAHAALGRTVREIQSQVPTLKE